MCLLLLLILLQRTVNKEIKKFTSRLKLLMAMLVGFFVIVSNRLINYSYVRLTEISNSFVLRQMKASPKLRPTRKS